MLGNVIFIMPAEVNGSVVVMLILEVVILLTVVNVAAAAPVKVEATALMVVYPIIFSNPFLRIFTVI